MTTATKRMIFHVPYPLDREASSASGIRPVRMHDAFEELGYEVWFVGGYSRERSSGIRRVKEAVRDGKRFDFCYSESSTMPMTMTDPRHLPLHPFMDFRFFRFLLGHGIKVGHFLRDIHWLFPAYRSSVRFPKRELALLAYRWDIRSYRTSISRLYLPSLAMGERLPWFDTALFGELPPAHGWERMTDGPTAGVRLFYVGGLAGHYRLHKLVEAVSLAAERGSDVRLTVCALPEQWEASRPEYEQYLSDAIRVVQGHGPSLRPHFEAANVGVLCVEPLDYWQFAAPVKLFDYLGSGKPVLSSRGTFAGSLVESEGLGWCVDYDVDAIVDWLVQAAADPEIIARGRASLEDAWQRHTWTGRAQQVADELSPR